jgi:ABC-type branched-subunit amino acid transport system substrate-binding protein
MIEGYCKTAYFPTGFTLQAKQPWVKQFIKDFREVYSVSPDYLSAQGYEVGRILVYLKSLNQLSLKNIHKTIQNFPGTTGLTTFLPNGEVSKKIYIMEIKHGRISLVP